MNTRNKRLLVQFVEYMISGGAYFWSGYLVFFICDKAFGFSLFWAKMAANLVGWTVNYLLQRYWVFRNPALRGHFAETSGRYLTITAVDFILDYLIVAGLNSIGISPYIGQFISATFFTGWNYLWYRFWVFPDKYAPAKAKKVARPSLRHSHKVIPARR